MLEETSCLDKPGPVVKPLPSKKRPLGYDSKATSDDPKKKAHLENPSDKNEVSAENTVEKPSLSSAQNGVSPPSLYGPAPPSTIVSDHNAPPTCFNHQQTHQWLVPVMSPTEGLVYKPYPGTGYVGHAYGGCGPPVGNFSTAMYGIPAPPPQQYPVPTFHPFGPHGYFPPYGMPMMTTSAFSGSSVEQTIPPAVLARSGGEATPTVPQEGAVSNGQNTNTTRETEVQASTASCLREKHQNSRTSNGRRNMLTLFPTSPATDAGQEVPVAEQPNRVIKVVPHNSMSASESAARIFRSIQEERKQYDAVV